MTALTNAQAERLRTHIDQACHDYAEQIPRHTLEGLRAYVCNGRAGGGFLAAVLSNDLMRAIGQADDANQRALAAICNFLWNRCPVGCWGSPENYQQWLAEKPALPRSILANHEE